MLDLSNALDELNKLSSKIINELKEYSENPDQFDIDNNGIVKKICDEAYPIMDRMNESIVNSVTECAGEFKAVTRALNAKRSNTPANVLLQYLEQAKKEYHSNLYKMIKAEESLIMTCSTIGQAVIFILEGNFDCDAFDGYISMESKIKGYYTALLILTQQEKVPIDDDVRRIYQETLVWFNKNSREKLLCEHRKKKAIEEENKKYWENHVEEKEELDKKKKEYSEIISDLDKDLKELKRNINILKDQRNVKQPKEKECDSIRQEIVRKNGEKNQLGFFKAKEKKEIEQQILQLESTLSSKRGAADEERKKYASEIDKKIDELEKMVDDKEQEKIDVQKQLRSVDDELTQNRCDKETLDKIEKECSSKTTNIHCQDKVTDKISDDETSKHIKDTIIKILNKNGKRMTQREISSDQIFVDDAICASCSSISILARLRELEKNGIVEKIVEDNGNYYKLV